jgi:hypothetical protein
VPEGNEDGDEDGVLLEGLSVEEQIGKGCYPYGGEDVDADLWWGIELLSPISRSG